MTGAGSAHANDAPKTPSTSISDATWPVAILLLLEQIPLFSLRLILSVNQTLLLKVELTANPPSLEMLLGASSRRPSQESSSPNSTSKFELGCGSELRTRLRVWNSNLSLICLTNIDLRSMRRGSPESGLDRVTSLWSVKRTSYKTWNSGDIDSCSVQRMKHVQEGSLQGGHVLHVYYWRCVWQGRMGSQGRSASC